MNSDTHGIKDLRRMIISLQKDVLLLHKKKGKIRPLQRENINGYNSMLSMLSQRMYFIKYKRLVAFLYAINSLYNEGEIDCLIAINLFHKVYQKFQSSIHVY